MKLHLPVKLRASLIAAVIAVGASVYNAYAYDYTNFGTKGFGQTTPALSGNTYTANEITRYWTDASRTTEVGKAADGKWYKILDDGSLSSEEHTEPAGGWTEYQTYAGELVFAATGSATPVTVLVGNTTLTADVVKFNNDVVAPETGVEGVTTIVADEVQINRNELGDPSQVNLQKLNIAADATKLDKYSELNIDNSAAADEEIDLGAVSGQGGLSIKGGTTATGGKTAVSMDSVLMQNKGNLTLDTVAAIVGAGDVAVNSLTITNSDAAVTGNVTVGGTLTVDGDSVLNATGNVLTTTQEGKGNSMIDGAITSTGGNIGLDNGYISGSVTTTSTADGKGNITLFNIEVKDGAIVDASGDLTVTGESTIIDNDEQDIEVNAGGDLTVSDGSIIQNVDATVGGGITVDDATVDNSVITGATGDITFINGAQVTDSIINGGRHFQLNETQNDVNIDGTKIINLTGDIKLSKVERTGLNLATQGTSSDDVTDYDTSVGGSIIIADSTIADSTIKSGVKTTIADDGTLSYSDVASKTISSDAGVNNLAVPYGKIDVATSTLTNVVATTKNGPIEITSSDITGSTVTTGNGNMTIGIEDAVSTSLTDPAKSIGRDNNQDTANTKKIRFTAGFGYLGAGDKINSIKVEEWSGGTVQTGVVATLKKNGVVVAVSKPVNLTGTNGNMVGFVFDYPVAIDPDATDYTLEFNKDVRIRLHDTNGLKIVQYGDNNQNWSSKVIIGSTDFDTNLLGSTVATNGGSLNMDSTYAAAADGKDTNITATRTSTIDTSMLDGGTNVQVTGGNLKVTGSYLLDDVNLNVSGEYDIKGETVINIDGGDAHDASFRAGTNLWADVDESVAGDTINIKNADVQIGERIEMFGNSTMNLTNVYAKDADGNKTASDLGRVKTRNGSGRGTLNITGSIIDAEAIWSNSGDNQNYNAENGTSINKYFADVNVDSSDVEVSGRALIENLDIANSSTVAILGGAYLDTTTIDGTSKLTTGGASKLDDVNIADGGTIRVTNTGDGVTTLANLNRDADTNGTVNVEVVNATLQTPVVDNRVVLGLSGGTLHIKSVAAHGSALAASDAPVVDPASLILTPEVNPHVVLSAVTDAGISTPAAGSTIKTDGLHRFQSFASSSEGTPATATNLYRYLYTVSADHTVAAGETLWVKDANGAWTLAAENQVLAAGTEVSKLNYMVTDAEVQYDGTVADPNLSAVTEIVPTLSLAEQEYLKPQTFTEWSDTVENVVVGTEIVDGVPVTYYQKVEKMDDIPYIDGYSKLPGSVKVSDDGIASLTVEGDFGAHKTTINAYKLATPVAFWLGGRELTIDQYKALSDADKAACTPEYKKSATVHYTIIDGTAFDALTATDLSYADKSVYTKLNPKTYTATGVSTLSVADYEKLDGDAGQAAYVAVSGYISKTDSSVTITTAQYNAMTDADKAGYEAGTIAWTNRVVKTQAEYNALTDAEKAEYAQNGSEYVKINTVTIKTCVLETLSADGQVAFEEDRRYFTTITDAAYASLTDAQKNAWEALVDWTAQDITSLRDGGYNGIFVDKNFLLDDTCCQDKGISSEMVKSDETGHIVIVGALSGNDNVLTADTTIEIGSITGSRNELNALETITTDAITGNDNVLNASGAIETGAITGSGNDLFSAEDITTGAIGGNDNELFTFESITTGAITGSGNKLTSDAESITTGAITGSGNELTAGTTLNVESIGGNENVLSAAESIVTGAITGNENELTSDTSYVQVNGALKGDGNKLEGAAGNQWGNTVVITGGIQADADGSSNGNTITALAGKVTLGASNGNALVGSENIITAEEGEVVLEGALSGSDNKLTAGTSISTGAINGGTNTLKADTSINTGAITGADNTLIAGTSISTGAINGGTNTLNAETSISTGAITGNDNTLAAVSNVTTGAITGNENELTSDTSYVQVNGALKGDGNKLEGAAGNQWGNTVVITGGIQADADGSSNGNTITALAGKVTLGASNGNALVGSSNTITAEEGEVNLEGALRGNSNELSGVTVVTKDIIGDSNILTGATITTEAINGDANELSAETISTKGITGDSNKLMNAETITTGAITGNSNELTGETINTGAIAGNSNELYAETITTGGINGETNKLTGETVNVNGKLEGSANKVTANTIHVNELAGTAQEIVSKGLESATEVAIDIDSLTGTNSTIEVQYPGKGSINIDSMTAQTGAGDNGTTITTLAGNVIIGTMDTTAKTAINVGTSYGITVGSGSASNQTWTASSLSITGAEGVTLTDSTVTILGAVDATKLTLTGETTLAATGNVKAGTLTLDGPDAIVNATKLTVTDMLELKGNANLGSVQVTTDGSATLKVTDSVLTTGMLNGFTGIELENSTGNLGGASLGTAAKPMTSVVATAGSELTASSIYTTGVVMADASEITIANDITAQSMVITNNGEIKADDVTLSGALDADGGTLKADSVTGATIATLNGATIDGALSMDAASTSANVTATNGTKIGSIANADAVTLTASSVTGNVGMNGALNMGAEATIGGAVTGATSATLNNADISGTLGMNGELNMTDASTGAVTGATNATLTDSIITGALDMGGELNMTNASTGAVTGATNATLDNASITGDLGMGGELTMTAASAGSVTGATNATLIDATIDGVLNASGTVVVDGGSIGSITGSATTVDLDNVESIGSITMSTEGTLNVADTVTGAVNAANGNTVANATLIDAMIGSGLNVTGTLDVIGDAGVAGNVTAGNLNVSDGTLFATDGDTLYDVTVNNKTTLSNGEVVAGTFTTKELELVDMAGEVEKLNAAGNVAMAGTSLDVTKTDADAVKVGGSMTLTQGAMLTNAGGAQITGDLKVDGSAFTNEGAVQAGSIVVKDGGVLTGTTVTANGVTVTSGGTLAGVVTSTGDVTVSNGSITGDVTSTGDVTATGSTIGGDVAAEGSVTLAGSIAGDVIADGSVKLTNGSTAGDVAAEGSVELAGSTAGDVAAEGSVTLAGSTAGDVAAAGSVELAGSIAGNVIADGSVKLTDATVGAVEADAATLAHSTINGALTAGDTVVSSDVVVKGSADVDGLTVNKGSSLIAADVTADGELDIQGAVMTTTGNVALTGAEGSTIAADVTAAGDVIISGTVAATEAAIKGANVTIEGTLAATEAAIKGADVTIDGTLAAGKGVSIIGTVGGAGTIVKTGGDTLALAGDTKIGGVTVKGSTLAVDGGADLGKLTVSDKSTVEIAGEGMGTVKVAAGSSIKDSVVNVDLSLNAKTRTAINGDVIDGSVDMTGTTVVLRADIDETSVKDQDSYKLVTGSVKGDYTVKHELDTLNVHAEGGDIVFSKNYKGAQNKTENQSVTADALASLTTPAGELAGVMDALAHTRSEAEALAALDSLGGVGLTAAPKLIADETKEHLQTLRSTLQSVSAGLERRYTASGLRLDSIESSGVTAAVTGGSSTVKEDGNAPEYSRNSIGAMFAAAHAINDEWVFGAAISFSKGDADCGYTTLESQGVFLDVGVMQKRGRFSQMGSIGCAFFSMDTERTVGVNSFGGTAEGTTDAAALTVSYETTYAIWQTESYSVSSVIMGEAVFAQIDNMEEEGLGNAGLRSSFDDVASFTFGAGARYTYHFGEETNPGYFSLEALFVADTGDSTMKVNNAFIGGGSSFQLSGPEAGNYGLRLNAGVLVPLGDQWGLFGNATGEIRSEQTTVGGSVGIKCTF